MSHFLYLHPEVSGVKDVYKIGIAITPYSAVRLRQRNIWTSFSIPYLFFGRPDDIKDLEKIVLNELYQYTGKALNNIGSQSELIKLDISVILDKIKEIINSEDLDVIELKLDEPYSAVNSGQCPLDIPCEKNCNFFLEEKVKEVFGTGPSLKEKKISRQEQLFQSLFDVV
jgi:hypothetical protein